MGGSWRKETMPNPRIGWLSTSINGGFGLNDLLVESLVYTMFLVSEDELIFLLCWHLILVI
jgi:hypothetical protein